MIPTNTATGISAIKSGKITTKEINNNAAVIADNLPQPLFEKLIIL